MLKHPNVIASCILGGSVLTAALMLCLSIRSLDDTIARKPIGQPVPGFPRELTVSLRAENDSPLPIRYGRASEGDAPLKVHVLAQP